MEDYKRIIEQAKAGQIVPIVRQIDMDDPMDFFAKISDYGRAQNCCRNIVSHTKSFVNPAGNFP